MKKREVILNYTGRISPYPTMKLARLVRESPDRDALYRVLADDPLFPNTMRAWCRASGATLVSLESREGVFEALITVESLASKGASHESADGLGLSDVESALISRVADCRSLDDASLLDVLDGIAEEIGDKHAEVALIGQGPSFEALLTRWCQDHDARLHHLNATHDGATTAHLELGASTSADHNPIFERSDQTHRNARAITASAPERHRTPLPSPRNTQSIDLPSPSDEPSMFDLSAQTPSPEPHPREPRSSAPPPRPTPSERLRAAIMLSRDDPATALSALDMAVEATHRGMTTTVFFTGRAIGLLISERQTTRSSLLKRLQRKPPTPSGEPSAEALQGAIARCQQSGVAFKICRRSLSALGWRAEDLVAGEQVELVAARAFIDDAQGAALCLSF